MFDVSFLKSAWARRLAVIAGFLIPGMASAHHEALFGPQSSLIQAVDNYVSLQAFSKQTGTAEDRTQETTVTLSGGLKPIRSVPVTVTAIVPYSFCSELDAGESRNGPENIVVGLRYRYDLKQLIEAWGKDGNFLVGMGAAEVPNGTMDYPSYQRWTGPMNTMGALLGSLEKGKWAGLAYGYYRYEGQSSAGDKIGDNAIAGAGVAFTPNENPQTGRLISYQLGLSYEYHFQDMVQGRTDPGTGGWTLLLHPALVYAPSQKLLVFGIVSLPLAQSYPDPLLEDRFRVGAGLTWPF